MSSAIRRTYGCSTDSHGRKRQYVHQLRRDKWNILKYNKPDISSPAQVSADMDSSQRNTLKAEILFSAGYSGASPLYKASLPPRDSDDTDVSSLRRIFFSFARASQTFDDASAAVKLIDTYINGCLRRTEGQQDEQNRDHALWVSTFDIMAARIQHDASDRRGCRTLALIEEAIGPFIRKGTGDPGSTFHRLQDHRVLIPFYLHLSYALLQWNDFANSPEQPFAVDDTLRISIEPVAVEDYLRMFIDRQLEPRGVHPIIDCLRGCLNWCIETLNQKLEIPKSLGVRQRDPVTGVYQIIGTLWRAYVTSAPTPSWPAPTWASSCEPSAGISAAELLVTLICAAMAPSLTKMSKPLERAREGFHVLDGLDRPALLDCFLRQLRRTSDPRMLAPRLPPANALIGPGKPPIFAAFVDSVTDTLGVERLPQAEAASIIPVVLAHWG